jgi:predicted RecB family nuclease
MDYSTGMKITPELFGAYLSCPTKCWFKSNGERGAGNAYAEWVESQNEVYRVAGIKRLHSANSEGDIAISPVSDSLKEATWRRATDVLVQTEKLESRVHALERVPSEGRGKPAQFIPIRFIARNKLTQNDKLIVAFDALTVSGAIGREVKFAKIIHGDDSATLKVKTPALADQVRKGIDKITTLLSAKASPDLILIRHCAECEFRDRCRQKAIEKDDLSLLPRMTEKDRKQCARKGIFTVTQLSYTFRPRRRPKRLRGKREEYHHALKALAIRTKTIHVVGSPALKIEGTPVYLDVEGSPDSDLYYLIGLKFATPKGIVRHSLWADSAEGEKQIWVNFVNILAAIERPVLVHYGSYETIFLKKMCKRYGEPPKETPIAKAITQTVNVLSLILGQFYFPSYSDGLKQIAVYLGFNWSDPDASGLNAIVWRKAWQATKAPEIKSKLITYNQEDCDALDKTTSDLDKLSSKPTSTPDGCSQAVVDVASLRSDAPYRFERPEFAVPDFERINKAAYWDYQHNRIRIRDPDNPQPASSKRSKRRRRSVSPNREVENPVASVCPECNKSAILKGAKRTKLVTDLRFTRTGMKRWVTKYISRRFHCAQCGARFDLQPGGWPPYKEGSGLLAYVVYQLIQQRVSQRSVADSLLELFKIERPRDMVNRLKARAACIYRKTCEQMMNTLVHGSVIHADETDVSIGGKKMFVWVFTNSKETVYYFTPTRDGEFPKKMLNRFKGVLVSDFYPAYDAIPCRQQKCLIHLMRDLNGDLLKAAFDKELKSLAFEFADILRSIVDTIDRFGLKTRFLKKHKLQVARFYRALPKRSYRSEIAAKYQVRFLKDREKLFVFLDHDGVPWNNNNAEHAIKAFVMLRIGIGGSSTEEGMSDYLVLLSILETCKCKGVSFLGFLRSGEDDIDKFAALRGSKKVVLR